MSWSTWWPIAAWLLFMGAALLAVSWRTIPVRCRLRTLLTVLICNLAGSVIFAWKASAWTVVAFAVVYCAALAWASEGFRRRRYRLPLVIEEGSQSLAKSVGTSG